MRSLNKEQKIVVEHFTGPCIVTATPGSGKTLALTSRVVRLLERGVDSRNILCLTFTNKAADEMRSRVVDMCSDTHFDVGKIWISTFHRLCLAIIRKHAEVANLTSSFSIYNQKDQQELISKIARMHEYEECKNYDVSRMCGIINDCRESLSTLDDFHGELKQVEYAILEEYLTLLDEFNAVDFSGILYKAWEIIDKNKSIAERLRNRFKYVLEDEGQDANQIQYALLKLLAPPPGGNLFVVGDENQSIFAFRGATPENLNKMREEYDNVKEISLFRNYRSTSQILFAAQKLIRNNEGSENVELESVRGKGKDIIIRSYYDPEEESRHIACHIKNLKKEYGWSWNDFVVLYRVNHLSKIPEAMFRQASIPYRMIGGFSFFDRTEIKTAMAYLSFFCNPNDSIAFSRAISEPKRGVGPTTIGRLERRCQLEHISMIEACRDLDAISGITPKARSSISQFVALMDKCLILESEGMGLKDVVVEILMGGELDSYYAYIKKISEEDDQSVHRLENLDEFILGLSGFEEQKDNPKVIDYLQTVQLITSDILKEKEEDAVTLMTMHSSKGREWKSVHIIGVERGFVPHFRAVSEQGDNEEERRIFYVSCTRPQLELQISYCQSRRKFDFRTRKSTLKNCFPSEFLEEIV